MLRPATEADTDAILALAVLEEDVWFGEAEHSAAEAGEWVESEGGITSGVVAVDAEGRVRGFACPGVLGTVFLADPADVHALTDELLPWLKEQREELKLLTYGGDAERLTAFERHGLRHEHSSFSLARAADAGPLPEAPFPGGVEVAPYELGEADEAVHRLIYVDAAWAAVPGHAERDLDSWLDKERPCQSLFLARRDGRPVGWVSGRLRDSGRGYISTLAVAQDERGHGLGRALLIHALRDLQVAGATDLTLDVEAHNEGALGLYRSVGMEVEQEWRTYETQPGP
jgi:ribosomal protein S18 acetylase RimI-like enzyme